MPTQSQINDEELDQMIANLQGQKASGSNSASAPAPSTQPTQGVQTTQPNLANTVPPSMANTPRPVNLSGSTNQPIPQPAVNVANQQAAPSQSAQNQVQRPTAVSNLDSIKSLAISIFPLIVYTFNPNQNMYLILFLIFIGLAAYCNQRYVYPEKKSLWILILTLFAIILFIHTS